jgi:hypothetical protein
MVELEDGEKLLWSGMPDVSRWWRPGDPGRLALSLAAGAFLILLATIIIYSNVHFGFSVVSFVGLVPATIGLYMLGGRVIARCYIGHRTAYGITDRRALVVRPKWWGQREISAVRLAEGPSVSQELLRDGHGTVWIGATIYQRFAWFGGDPGWYAAKPYERQDVTFWNIAEAEEVSRLAAGAIASAQGLA